VHGFAEDHQIFPCHLSLFFGSAYHTFAIEAGLIGWGPLDQRPRKNKYNKVPF